MPGPNISGNLYSPKIHDAHREYNQYNHQPTLRDGRGSSVIWTHGEEK